MTRSSIARAAASGLVALTLLFTGGVALAANVSGIVKNQANLGLPGVTMEWRNEATAAITDVTTNASGNYSVVLDPATYTVKLTEPASGTVSTVPDVTITGNTTRDFVLILSDRLPPIEFHGRVLREDTGGPAVNLRIDLLNRTTNTWYQNQIRTDADGYYTWSYWPEVGQTYGSWYYRAYTGYMPDRGTLQAGWVLVRDYIPATGDLQLDFMIRTVTTRGIITRCNEDGTDSGVPVEGVTMRSYWGHSWGYNAYSVVDPVTGEFETTVLQGALVPTGVTGAHIQIQAQSTGYCAPFETEPLAGAPGVTIGHDAFGSTDVPDVTYTKCLPVVPLMKTRVVDVEGNPIGNVEVQVYNDSTNKWVVQGGYRYTQRDRNDPATYGSACFGVSEGNLRVWFNSRSFDGGTTGGVYYGGTWGKTPAGRWQVNGFTMPSTGLDLGDQEIPTLFLRGQTNPPLPNVRLYALLNWSTSYGYQYANTDADGKYELAIIPTDKITLPYNPASTSTTWTLQKQPPYGADCGGTPCVIDFESLPQSDTAGYLQGATSAKTTIDWTPGVALTGTTTDWDGGPVPLMRMQFYRQENGYNWWAYCYEQASNSLNYDQDGDSYNGSHLCWIAPHEYRYVYTYMPSYTNFNPRSDAPHVPLNRSITPWLQNYLISASGAVLPWDTRETAHAINIRVLTSLGLGVPGAVVNFDETYQSGKVFNNRGDADMYPYGGEAGSPVDPAVQFNVNSWVTITPPEATGLPAFRISESTTTEKTLTYIYPVVNPNVPIILNWDIVARTEYSLTSQFVADQLVDGIMCCGLDVGALNACSSTTDLSETHTLEVDGLQPGTDYQCQVCGANASGQDGCSELFTGTTIDVCDTLAPTQANFAYNVSDTKINVTWTTNEACQGSIVVDGDPLSVVFEDKLGSSHAIVVDGLFAETEYVLSVSCTDTCGNTRTQTSAVTTLETQTDPDVIAPTCSGVVADLGETYVIFQVTCNEPSTVNVQCSDTGTFQIYIGQNNTAAITLPVSVTSLTPATTYQCGANGIDAFDNQAPFDLPDVTTPSTVLPMTITAGPLVSASDTLANVSWVTGDSGGNDRAGTTEINFAPKAGTTCSDPATWPTANKVKNLSPVVNHSVDLNGLASETTYCYQVRSVGLNSTAQSAVLEFTTLAAPVVLAIETIEVTPLPSAACEDMLVALTTSKPAEVILQVGAVLRADGGLLNPITAYGRPAASAHTITVGGLTPGVTHYYTVLVYDQDGATVRYPATGLATFNNCGGPPNEPPVVVGTGSGYTAECAGATGTEFTLSGTVRDPYGCTLTGCPGDEELACSWIDTITDEVVASAFSTGAIPGSPDEVQSCSTTATFPLGTSFVKLEAAEQATNGLTGLSGTFQVLVRDTSAPCVSAGPDVAWGAVASDCTVAGGAPGVLVDVLDTDGDGIADIAARPLAETGICNDAAVWDTCDAAPTVATIPAAYDVANYGPYVHCVAYGQTVTITYQATDSVGNKGSDTFTVSVADLCDGVDCSGLDGDCLVGVCNPATGACGTTPKPNLTTCDDFDDCTVSDVCRGGVCGGAPKCDYLNSAATCSIGVCEGAGVCHRERNPDLSCNHAPTPKCVAIEAILDASGNVSITAASVAGTSIDADSDAMTMSVDPDSFSCADLGSNTVVASVSDFALTSTCNATVTVTDKTAPTMSCPADVAANTDAGTCTAAVTYADPTTNDNCGGTGVSLTSGLGSGKSFGLGTHTESWLATDAGSNTATCSFDVVVTDAEAPTVACPADIAAENDAGQCGAVVSFATPTGADNCGVAGTVQTSGPLSGASFAVGESTPTFTTTDNAGLSASCQFVITVADTEQPAMVCPSDVVTGTDAGQCGAVVSFSDAITTDNCNAASLALTEGQVSGSLFAVGGTDQTFEATDGAGLTTSCGFRVTVNDDDAPSISCPADVSAGTDDGTCAAMVTYAAATASDNCAGATASLASGLGSGASFGLGAHTESWTAADAAGNSASCDFAVTVSDDDAPTISCPADIAANNDAGQCSAVVTFAAATGADNCGVASTDQTGGPASGAAFAVGTTTPAFTTTDTAGLTASCQFAVTVADAEAPAISCPSDVSVNTDAGACGAVVSFADATASDNCGAASVALSGGQAAGTFFAAGATTESFTATDSAGLTASCDFNVTVTDAEGPSISCAADVAATTDAGTCTAVVSYGAATATDNCSATTTVSLASGLGSGASFGLGAHTESWQAADAAGNSASCDLAVTVSDAEAPSLSCPADIAANTAAGTCTAAVSFATPTASDNCAVASTTQTSGLASGADFPAGTTAQSFAAADDAGNAASCAFNVTVSDVEGPTLGCPADIAVGTDAGECAATVTFAAPTAADNCGVASTTQTSGVASGGSFPLGGTSQAFETADAAGLTATCGFNVTVSDTEAPTITCPADVVVGDGDGCTAFVAYAAPTAADNCGGVSTALTSGLGSGNVFPVGDTVETWTATDGVGRTTSCSFTVTVLNTDGDGDNVPCLQDSDDTNPYVCRDVDGDTCDDCASGLDNVASDGADLDADGICDDGDPCIADPIKSAPGICGCNYPDVGDADADGVLDCVDICAGSDDTVDLDMNGIPDGCDNIGVLVDNDNANNTPGLTESSQVGEWTVQAGPPDAYLNDSTRSVAGVGDDTATFTAFLPQDGKYEVYAGWVAFTRNASNAPYTITDYTGAQTTVRVDQTVAPSGAFFDAHELQLLGTFEFRGGAASSVVLTDNADGRVSADVVAFKFVGGITIEATKPVLTVVRALDPTTVEVVFAEPIDPKTNATDWIILDGAGVPLVIRGGVVSGNTVVLSTDPHAYNAPYQLEVRTVYDLFGNLLLSDTWDYVLAMPTVIVDNPTSTEPVLKAVCVTSWTSNKNDLGYYGNDQQVAANRRSPTGTCTYSPNVAVAGEYTVAARWTYATNRTTNARYSLTDRDGTRAALDVTQAELADSGRWNDLGTVNLTVGQGGVVLAKGTDSKFTVADAIRFKPVVALGASGPESTATSTDGSVTLTHNSDYNMWIEPIATPADGSLALATALPALTIVGSAYEVGPSGTFPDGSPALMTLTYDDADLPAGTDETTLEIYTLNGSVWEALVTVSRDTDANIIVAEVPHLSVFAVVAKAAGALAAPVVATDVTASPAGRYDTFRPPELITVNFRLPAPYDVADVALPIGADKTVDAVSVTSADGVASVSFDGAELLDLAGPNVTTRTHTLTGFLRARAGDETPPDFDWVPFEATVTFEIVTSLDKSKVHVHGSKPYAHFEGSLVLTEGQLAEDFRSAIDAGHGTVSVTLGADGLVAYENSDITFGITGATQENKDEKWTHKGANPIEQIKFRWDTAPEYDAGNDPDLPASVGELYSEFIHVADTSLQVDFKKATLPLTVVIDGIVLLTIQTNGSVESALPVEVHRKKATVLFPDRLVPGNVIEWYRDGDTSDGVQNLVYTHECAADGTASATYINGTARFDITVPLPADLDTATLAPQGVLAFTVGEPGTTLVNEALMVIDYRQDDDHGDVDWKYHDRNDRHGDDADDDDDHDHGHCHGRD